MPMILTNSTTLLAVLVRDMILQQASDRLVFKLMFAALFKGVTERPSRVRTQTA